MKTLPKYPKIQSIYKRDDRGRMRSDMYSCPEFDDLSRLYWKWTEKVDGMNIRVGRDGNKVIFRGRTDTAMLPVPLVEVLEQLFPCADALYDVFDGENFCLYGEGYGGKIRESGPQYSERPRFVLFDVLVGDVWLQQADIEDVARQLAVEAVPVIWEGQLRVARAYRDQFDSELASAVPRMKAEGLVGKPPGDLLDRQGRRIIAKIKARDKFLEDCEYARTGKQSTPGAAAEGV